MIYGKNEVGILIEAYPSLKENAFCPLCDSILIKKCGSIKIWHWAHKSLIDCDEWSEPETRWHLEWKKFFKDNGCEIEVPIDKHRADAISKNRLIYEIQNSIISPEEIKKRNDFYKERNYRICWIFNAQKWHMEFKRLGIDTSVVFSFRWKWPHRSLYQLFSPYPKCFKVFFDFNNGKEIFEVRKCYLKSKFVGGYGVFGEKDKIAVA